jgi:hypothetical protein
MSKRGREGERGCISCLHNIARTENRTEGREGGREGGRGGRGGRATYLHVSALRLHELLVYVGTLRANLVDVGIKLRGTVSDLGGKGGRREGGMDGGREGGREGAREGRRGGRHAGG